MAMPQPIAFISEEEYLNGDLVSNTRHEYVNGHVHAIAGASDRHGLIAPSMPVAS